MLTFGTVSGDYLFKTGQDLQREKPSGHRQTLQESIYPPALHWRILLTIVISCYGRHGYAENVIC